MAPLVPVTVSPAHWGHPSLFLVAPGDGGVGRGGAPPLFSPEMLRPRGGEGGNGGVSLFMPLFYFYFFVGAVLWGRDVVARSIVAGCTGPCCGFSLGPRVANSVEVVIFIF